jgi:glycosyltransferase involved in cell wall biosynthesis
VDGSPDDSGAVLSALLATSALDSQLIWHARNFGSFAAIRTGMRAARREFVAVMAADLQEPPELIPAFHRVLAGGEFDVALGVRRSREDPRGSRAGAQMFWAFYRRFVQPDMPRGGVDIFACTGEVADRLSELDEANSSLVGLLIWMGYRRTEVPYDRAPREVGKSGWTLRRKVRYLLDSIYSFTDLPISLLLILGFGGVIATLLGSVLVFSVWAFGGVKVAGYTPLMLTLLLASSMILFGLGVVGSYVWRTYENSKGRPHALVRAGGQPVSDVETRPGSESEPVSIATSGTT